jgi:hypothetical protein
MTKDPRKEKIKTVIRVASGNLPEMSVGTLSQWRWADLDPWRQAIRRMVGH